MPEMYATPESSNVAEIGYDDQAQEVYVTFLSGRSYAYMNVPAIVWEEFRNAPSKGTFVNTVLKPGYGYRPA